MAARACLEGLPQELLENIVQRIDNKDLRALRLTSRGFEYKTFVSFREAHFTEHCIYITTPSLTRFVEISESDRVRHQIKKLWVLMEQFECIEGVTCVCRENGCSCERSVQAEHLSSRSMLSCDQSVILRDGTAGKMLLQAFHGLTNLSTLLLMDHPRQAESCPISVLNQVICSCGKNRCTHTDDFCTTPAWNIEILRLLVQAIGLSPVSLRAFKQYGTLDFSLVLKDPTMHTMNAYNVIKQLEVLRIGFDSPDHLCEGSLERLEHFTSSFDLPALRHLSISHAVEDPDQIMTPVYSRLLSNMDWSNLLSLRLYGIEMDLDEWKTAFANIPNVRILELDRVQCLDGWSESLEVLAQLQFLDHLHLSSLAMFVGELGFVIPPAREEQPYPSKAGPVDVHTWHAMGRPDFEMGPIGDEAYTSYSDCDLLACAEGLPAFKPYHRCIRGPKAIQSTLAAAIARGV